eukprot:639973-Prymnesium_polylepis.1
MKCFFDPDAEGIAPTKRVRRTLNISPYFRWKTGGDPTDAVSEGGTAEAAESGGKHHAAKDQLKQVAGGNGVFDSANCKADKELVQLEKGGPCEAAVKKDEEQQQNRMHTVKAQLRAQAGWSARQSNDGDESKALLEAAKVLLQAGFEEGALVGARLPHSSTYKGNIVGRADDRRRTSKSKASDTATRANMMLALEDLEQSGICHAKALGVLQAIARDADLKVETMQYAVPKGADSKAKGKRTTSRKYLIPIYELRGWLKLADKVKDAISLFADPRRSAQQKKWSVVRKRKREA